MLGASLKTQAKVRIVTVQAPGGGEPLMTSYVVLGALQDMGPRIWTR